MTRSVTARLDILDVFRGLAVAGMIVVTSPGDWNAAYPLLRHAAWNGWTPADMVFPAFLFAVGMALGLSFPRSLAAAGARRALWIRVARRTAALVAFGLAVNWLYTADIFGIPVYVGHPGWAHLRLPGVLQRIAFCYVAAVGLILTTARRADDNMIDVDPKAVVIAIVLLLVGYWLLMRLVPVPGYGIGRLDQEGNLASYLDRAVFTVPHMWDLGWTTWGGPVVFDPEGLLSTLPAITNTLFGVLAARAWRSTRPAIGRLALAGVALVTAGLLLDPLFPINKPLWTSSFALLSSGVSALAVAAITLLLRSRSVAILATPLRILGANAVLGFLLSIVLTKFGGAPWFRVDGATVTAQTWGYVVAHRFFADDHLAATACALGVLAIVILVLWPLHRRAIRFRL